MSKILGGQPKEKHKFWTIMELNLITAFGVIILLLIDFTIIYLSVSQSSG